MTDCERMSERLTVYVWETEWVCMSEGIHVCVRMSEGLWVNG